MSGITDRLWEDYQGFIARDLGEVQVEYLFVDAVYESLRRHGAKEALLVAWCIATDGRKHLLHLAVGNKESEAAWTEFFRGLLGRNMRLPTTVTSDGAPGLVAAIEACFPSSVRIRCSVPPAGKHPRQAPRRDRWRGPRARLRRAGRPTLDAARAAAERVVTSYQRQYPAAVGCFTEDLEALLAIHRGPVRHRIRVRTTNPEERSFVEERRRTKVTGRLPDEKAAMKLVFATSRSRPPPRPDARASPHDHPGHPFTGDLST